MPRTSLRSHVAKDHIDHLVDIELVGLDHNSILRRTQWSDGTLRVDAVSLFDLSSHGSLVRVLAPPLVLSRPPADLLVEARGQEELVIGVGEHDGADV